MKIYKIIFPILAITISLVSAELIVRLGGFWQTRNFYERTQFIKGTVDSIPFTYKPLINQVWAGFRTKTNSLGLVDDLEPDSLKPNCRRILFVGGSFTLGFGVDWDQAYPQQLEKILNKESCHQVINAAQDAYTAMDSVALLKYLIPLYKPHQVFFDVNRFGYDDSMSADSGGLLVPGGHHSVFHDFLETQWWPKPQLPGAASPFYLWRLLGPKVSAIFRPPSSPEYSATQVLNPRQSFEDQGQLERLPQLAALHFSPRYLDRFYQSLQEALQLAKTNDFELIFLTLDVVLDETRLPTKIRQVSLQQITNMSSLKFLRKYNLNWDFHPNVRGHKLMAEGIYNFLQGKPVRSVEDWKSRYWQEKTSLVSEFKSKIDFAKDDQAFQILGGININRTLSSEFFKTSLLLNPKNASVLKLRGQNLSQAPEDLEFQIGAPPRIETHTISNLYGQIDLKISLEHKYEGLTDVQIRCPPLHCEALRLDFVGLE